MSLGDFKDEGLLRQALTHRSAGRPNNERLEFFGDALLDLVVSEALLERLPRADEGTLTRLRASVVRESALAAVARRLGLGDRLILGGGELKSGGYRRDSILADALEAVIAAVYFDQGFDETRRRVMAWFGPELERLDGNAGKDAKTRLQEWLQARQLALPEYELLAADGPDHAQVFRVRCRVVEPGYDVEAEGGSRRAAEQSAAGRILDQLDEA